MTSSSGSDTLLGLAADKTAPDTGEPSGYETLTNKFNSSFVKILLSLSNIGALDLREFKTSSQLVSELKNKEKFLDSFKYLTRIFENIWYGDHKIETDFYIKISNEFNQFDNLVRESG